MVDAVEYKRAHCARWSEVLNYQSTSVVSRCCCCRMPRIQIQIPRRLLPQYNVMLCYVRIYCCKSDHVRLLCSQSAMAYNSVDRYQLKAGTRPFPLLHASAVTNTMRHARGAVVFVSICAYLRARAPARSCLTRSRRRLCVGMPRWLMRCSALHSTPCGVHSRLELR